VNDEVQDPQKPDAPQPGGDEARTPEPEKKAPETPVFVTPPTRQWRGGINPSRWTSYGCIAAIVVLIGMLVFGVVITKKTAWMALNRNQRRVLAAAERLNSPSERLRTARNLDRFEVQLRVTRDPYPLMGEFFKLVREGFEDGTLSAEELEAINGFLENKLPAGAAYGMQE
jgi:hypothetical protein